MKAVLKKALKGIVILIGAGWFATKIFWPSTFTDAPEILANLYAKELCTCRYVLGQSLERCFENHAIIARPSFLEMNDREMKVKVRVLWATSEARVVSEHFGCARTPL